MQIGLFGKLPAKGDFVARTVPGEVLQHWENWLEKTVGGARHLLGPNWQHTYDIAPVWRFWIGEMVFGHPVTGALIPSTDRVGRRFPLTLLLTDGHGAWPAHPLADDRSNSAWYDQLEAALLQAVGQGFNGDVDGLLASLSLPEGAQQARPEDRRYSFVAYGESGLERLLLDVQTHDHQLAAAGRSYWWTQGNEHVGPAMLAESGLPDATGFAAMLSGFGPPPDVTKPTGGSAPLAAAPPPPPLPGPEAGPWASTPDDHESWAPPLQLPPEPQAEPFLDMSTQPDPGEEEGEAKTPIEDAPDLSEETEAATASEPEDIPDTPADPVAEDPAPSVVDPQDSEALLQPTQDISPIARVLDALEPAAPPKEDNIGSEAAESDDDGGLEPPEEYDSPFAAGGWLVAAKSSDTAGPPEPAEDGLTETAAASEIPVNPPQEETPMSENAPDPVPGDALEDPVMDWSVREDDVPPGDEMGDEDASPFGAAPKPEKPKPRGLGGFFSLGGRRADKDGQ